MTREDFQRYLDAFNNDDFDGFSSFYADDVDFNLGDRKRIVGKQGIVDFYRPVKEHIKEDLRIIDIAVAPDGIGLHVYTKFTTFKDWPDFELWPTMAGDVREIESLVLYKYNADDKFTYIKSARFREY